MQRETSKAAQCQPTIGVSDEERDEGQALADQVTELQSQLTILQYCTDFVAAANDPFKDVDTFGFELKSVEFLVETMKKRDAIWTGTLS